MNPGGSPFRGRIGRRRALLLGSALGVVLAVLGLLSRVAFPKTKEPSPEVLQAIRLLLSEDPREEARGEHALRRMGPAIIPQLRYWVRKARNESDRVDIVLSDLEGKPAGNGAGDQVSANEFFHRKLLECRALTRRGDMRPALALAEAVVLLDTDGPYAWELRRLARRARERLVAAEVLEPGIEVERMIYEAGERPELLFRVTNHQPSLARIRLDKGILGVMDMVITRQSIDGSSQREERKLRIRAPEAVEQILVGPGQSWEQPVEFDTLEAVPRAGVVARVQIEGRFRPTRWTAESKDENLSLSMPRTEFWIVAPGQGDLCDRPLEKVTTALFFSKLEPFFTGGQLAVWAGEEDPYLNEKLIETLIANLEELDPERQALANRLLNQSTGQAFPPDPKRWKSWWARMTGKAGPEEKPAGKLSTETR